MPLIDAFWPLDNLLLHLGRRGVFMKTLFSSSHRCLRKSAVNEGIQLVSASSRFVRSICTKSSIEAWTAVPRLAAMPAFFGNPWRLNQYCRGHASNRFQAEGESVGAVRRTGHDVPSRQGSSRLLIVKAYLRPSLSEIHTPIAFGGNMAKANVKINDSVDTENALVLCCFPSVGMVSSVIAHFLIEKLELEFVGGVVDPQLPPMCLVNEKPLPSI